MKKAGLVELINSKFPHLDHLSVEAWVGRAWSELIYQIYKIEPSSVDFFCVTYHGIAVEQDAYDQYYSTLPVQIVQLPDSADGVRRIMYEKDGVKLAFHPIERDSWSVFEDLDVNKISTEVGYSTHHDKVLYERNPNVPTVQMDIVPTFESYDDDAELSAPMGFDAKLIAIVTELINGTPPENKMS